MGDEDLRMTPCGGCDEESRSGVAKEGPRSVFPPDSCQGLRLHSKNKQNRTQPSVWYWYLGPGFARAAKEFRPLPRRHCSLPGMLELVADGNQYSFCIRVAANHFSRVFTLGTLSSRSWGELRENEVFYVFKVHP